MSDLVAFLREQLGEDERMASAAKRALDEWQVGNRPDQRWAVDANAPLGVYIGGEWCCVGEGPAAHIGAQSPERMLAEVEAKREIVELHSTPHECSTFKGSCEWVADPADCSTLRLLTLPYRDRPGYDPAWSER